MTGTSKATIISRTENMGEPAITSWGEQTCIRVLRLDGTMGGFRWGVDAKRWLLQHESPRG